MDPQSVALVGASAKPSSWGHLFCKALARGLHRRRVYLINPRGGAACGIEFHPDLTALPEVPELVVPLVSDVASRDVLRIALELGVKGAIVIGTPFSSREDPLLRDLVAAGVVVLGPNCMGTVAPHTELDLSPPLLGDTGRDDGRVAVISQSGTVGVDVTRQLVELRLGLSVFFSIGDQYALRAGDMLRWAAGEEHTDAAIVYIEDAVDGISFRDGLDAARRAGKPVIVLSAGATPAGRRAAASHTGALANDARTLHAVCAAAEARLARSPAEAVELVRVALRPVRARGRRVGIISEGGGTGAIGADLVGTAGLEVPPLSPATAERLTEALTLRAEAGNPVDLPGSRVDVRVFATAARVLADSGEVDQILVAGSFGGLSAREPDREDAAEYRSSELDAAQMLSDIQHALAIPVVVQSIYPHGEASVWLDSRDVLVWRHLDAAVRSLVAGAPERRSTISGPSRGADSGSPLALQAAGAALDYWMARELVRSAGVPLVAARRITAGGELAGALNELGTPVVLKALGRTHKSDGGGVQVGISSLADAEAVFSMMINELGARELAVEADASTPRAVEVLVGARRTERYGVVALVGIGGVHAEVIDDVAVSLHPVSSASFEQMIGTLRMGAILTSARTGPVDLDAIRRAVAALADLLASRTDLAEVEVNPLLCTPNGVVAVDARAVARATVGG